MIRRRLGAKLKSLREAVNLRLEYAASSIECSTSKLSRLEHGQVIPRSIEVNALLDLYEVTDGRLRDRISSWTEMSKATAWWQPYSDAMPTDLELYLSLEAEALLIRHFCNNAAFPGLLQTARYARATLEPSVGADEGRLAALVDVRMTRQTIMKRVEPDPPRLECILAEESLYRRVGSQEVMREQLQQLVDLSRGEAVTLAVLPLRSRRPIANSVFTIFTPLDEDDWEIANEEGNFSDQWFETADQVNAFRVIWDDLRRRSIDGQKARDLISEVLKTEYSSSEG